MEEKQLNIDTEAGTLEEETVETEQPKMTRSGMLAALAAAVADGNLTSQQARGMRQQLGVMQADFTKKRPTKAKRKARRAMQKASRKANRKK